MFVSSPVHEGGVGGGRERESVSQRSLKEPFKPCPANPSGCLQHWNTAVWWKCISIQLHYYGLIMQMAKQHINKMGKPYYLIRSPSPCHTFQSMEAKKINVSVQMTKLSMWKRKTLHINLIICVGWELALKSKRKKSHVLGRGRMEEREGMANSLRE